MLIVPTFPDASRTVAFKVCVPLATELVFQGIETGPREPPALVLLIWTPSTLSVKTFADPVVPSAQSTTHVVPVTEALLAGCVMKAFTALAGGGGGGAVALFTVMGSVM